MNKKVEFGIFVFFAVGCNKLFFNILGLSVGNFLNLPLAFRMALEEVYTLAYDLLDEVFPVNSLCVLMHYECAVL